MRKYQAHVLATFTGHTVTSIEVNQADDMNAAWHFPPNQTRATLLSSQLHDSWIDAFDEVRNLYNTKFRHLAKDFPL